MHVIHTHGNSADLLYLRLCRRSCDVIGDNLARRKWTIIETEETCWGFRVINRLTVSCVENSIKTLAFE